MPNAQISDSFDCGESDNNSGARYLVVPLPCEVVIVAKVLLELNTLVAPKSHINASPSGEINTLSYHESEMST